MKLETVSRQGLPSPSGTLSHAHLAFSRSENYKTFYVSVLDLLRHDFILQKSQIKHGFF